MKPTAIMTMTSGLDSSALLLDRSLSRLVDPDEYEILEVGRLPDDANEATKTDPCLRWRRKGRFCCRQQPYALMSCSSQDPGSRYPASPNLRVLEGK